MRLAVYWLMTAVLVLGANQLVLTSTHYRAKVSRVDRHFQALGELVAATEAPITLVIGNSYVYNSFQVPADRDDIYKFTVNGMAADELLSVVESLPSHWPISDVVVGLGYDYASPVESNGFMYRRYRAGNPLSRAWWSIPLVRAHSLTVTMLKLELTCLRTVGRRNCRDREGVAAAELPPWMRSGGAARDPEHRRSVEKRLLEYRPFTASVSPAFGAKLARLQGVAQGRGIRLHAYTAPIVPTLRERLPAQTLREFRAAIDAAGLHYVDLNERFGEWPAGQFSDATHVDPKTAGGTTTAALLDFLATHPDGA